MRVLFIGGQKRGFQTIERLLDLGADFAGIISLEQDAHEHERFETPIRELAEAHRIPIHQTKWMKDRDYAAIVRDWAPDVAFLVGVRILIPPAIYTIPPRGALAVHPSLLPDYRGFAPVNWAIINGETELGITLFYLDEGTDSGPILGQKTVPIGPDDDAAQVWDRACAATVELIAEQYPRLAANVAQPQPQDEARATYACSRTPVDGMIDWSRPTHEIYNLIRGLAFPYPGAHTHFDNEPLTVWQARPVEPPPAYVGRIPGRVVGFSREVGHVDVLTGDGVLRLLRVQTADGPAVPPADLIHSVKVRLGLSVAELWSTLRALQRELAGRNASDDNPRNE